MTTDYEALRSDLDAALAGRGEWKKFRQIWSSSEFSAPGQLHTSRYLDVRWSLGGPVVHAQKDNAWGQPCDVEEFTGVIAAAAWVETPRSEHPESHRRFMAQMDAEERRPKPRDVACGHCGAQPGKPCTARTGCPLGDDIHAKRITSWRKSHPQGAPT